MSKVSNEIQAIIPYAAFQIATTSLGAIAIKSCLGMTGGALFGATNFVGGFIYGSSVYAFTERSSTMRTCALALTFFASYGIACIATLLAGFSLSCSKVALLSAINMVCSTIFAHAFEKFSAH